MALFEKVWSYTANTSASKDDWYDLGGLLAQDSPIPADKRLWLGFLVFDGGKKMDFELRSNTAGLSAGTVGATVLVVNGTTDPASQSAILDYHQAGNILVVAPTTFNSSGVEKLWLRVTSTTATIEPWRIYLWYTTR